MYVGCVKCNNLLNTHKPELIHCNANLSNIIMISGMGSLCAAPIIARQDVKTTQTSFVVATTNKNNDNNNNNI